MFNLETRFAWFLLKLNIHLKISSVFQTWLERYLQWIHVRKSNQAFGWFLCKTASKREKVQCFWPERGVLRVNHFLINYLLDSIIHRVSMISKHLTVSLTLARPVQGPFKRMFSTGLTLNSFHPNFVTGFLGQTIIAVVQIPLGTLVLVESKSELYIVNAGNPAVTGLVNLN